MTSPSCAGTLDRWPWLLWSTTACRGCKRPTSASTGQSRVHRHKRKRYLWRWKCHKSVISWAALCFSFQTAAVSPDCSERIRRAARRAALREDGIPLLPRLHQPAARAGPHPPAVHPAGEYDTRDGLAKNLLWSEGVRKDCFFSFYNPCLTSWKLRTTTATVGKEEWV